MTITRREFLSGAAAASAAVLTKPYRLLPPPAALYRPVLVYVFLRGGIDGLSVAIPYAEPRYYRERPHIAIPSRQVLKLDERFGLHPSLASLKPVWDAGMLAVFPAAGLSDPRRSHLDAQNNATRLLSGATPVPSLDEAARLIQSGAAPDRMRVDIGGWDTHFNQGASVGPLATRLESLAQGLATLAKAGEPRGREAVVVTISEFGRTIRENANGGTDHGHATTMLAIGESVNGGRVMGRWPGLDTQAHLPVTSDLGDVLVSLSSRIASTLPR